MGMNSIRIEAGTAAMIARKTKTISCLEGSLWVTAKGRTEDVLLTKGERLDVRGLKKVCAQSFGRSIIACLDSESERPHNTFPWTLARIACKKFATSSLSF